MERDVEPDERKTKEMSERRLAEVKKGGLNVGGVWMVQGCRKCNKEDGAKVHSGHGEGETARRGGGV